MPDSKLNDDRMDQLKARRIQHKLNPVTSLCCKALYQEFLNPGFVKNRIKWCKKQREHDGLDEARGISCGEQVFLDCAHAQGKCYFHFVDLGDDGKQGLGLGSISVWQGSAAQSTA